MPLIIDYILKLNICLAVVYLFYQLFLRRLTFYNWNRWYLLGYTALSFVIPLIDIMPSLEKRALQQNLMVQWIPAISFAKPAEPGFFEKLTYWDWAIAVLILGSLVLLIRFLIRFYSFKKMKAKAQLISGQDTMIYQLDEPITPFSFGNAIFINTEMHSGEELEEIIRHEFVHVKQRHTIDIMWCELLCMLNWFNPFVWVLRHNVKQNLEFIADHKVLQSGLDRKEYQYLLLKVMGNRQFAFTNHFNFSSLKKRIAMMNTIKSAKVQLIKFMFLLPVVAILLLSFRKEMKAYQEQVALEVSEDNNAEVKWGTNSEAPAAVVNDTVPSKAAGTATTTALKNQVGMKGLEKKPLIIVDGDRKGPDYDLDAVSPNDIQSIDILKDASAVTQYGEAAENGVIRVTTKQGVKASAIRLRTVNPEKDPLYIVDGKVLEGKNLEDIKPNDIESITVLKDASSKAIYGAGAENGVVVINTKTGKKEDGDFLIGDDAKSTQAESAVKVANSNQDKQDDKKYSIQIGRPKPKLEEVTVVGYKSNTASSALKGKVTGVKLQRTTTYKNEAVVVNGYPAQPKGKVEGLQIQSTGKAAKADDIVVTGYPGQRVKKHIRLEYKSSPTNILANPPENAHYVLNGESVSVKQIKNLDGANVKSIDVLKGDDAKKYYGSKAKEGAIVITTH